MKTRYVDIKLGRERLAAIEVVNGIIAEYAARGFQLTLRQLYYQHVARGLIANNDHEYKKLGGLVNDGRLAGLIDWDTIVDRTRNLISQPFWLSPDSIVRSCVEQFSCDLWRDQQYRIETWIEKDALLGVIERVCDSLMVPYFSCRGYTSQSEMHTAALRLKRYIYRGQTPVILHLGDHDPSGKDMTRDIVDRMELFMGGLEVRRLALNIDQIEEFHPPPNPAKVTDSRSTAYIAEFGNESWELDALEPSVLSGLIETAVLSLRDHDAWNEAVREQEEARAQLYRVSEQWQNIVDFLNG